MTEQIDATNTTEHMADAESTAESAKAAVRGVEETHPEYVDFAVDDFPGGLPACLEAILMVADQPQTATELARILALDRNTVEEALRALHDDYEAMNPVTSARAASNCAAPLVAGSSPVAPRSSRSSHHSSPTPDCETQSGRTGGACHRGYRQPVTRAQVAAIRGVNSDGVIRSLTVRGLIKEDGVDPESRAALLVTSEFFLDQMGLKSLDELPSLAPFLPSVAEMTQSKSEDTDVIS